MEHVQYLLAAIEESIAARKNGNTPFGAVLVDADGNIVLRQQNVEKSEKDCTGHAETALMRNASKKYTPEFLWKCTLYTTAEPCVMCTGAVYWGNVGRIVYGISETKLLDLTGDDPQNPTFSLPCREVLARGQKRIQVLGPFPEMEKRIVKVHEGFWL